MLKPSQLVDVAPTDSPLCTSEQEFINHHQHPTHDRRFATCSPSTFSDILDNLIQERYQERTTNLRRPLNEKRREQIHTRSFWSRQKLIMKTSSSSVLRRAMTSIALVAFVVLAVFTFMPVGANAEVEKDNDFGTVIGIDLGTTYSCVAYVSLAETHDPHLPSCDPFADLC